MGNITPWSMTNGDGEEVSGDSRKRSQVTEGAAAVKRRKHILFRFGADPSERITFTTKEEYHEETE